MGELPMRGNSGLMALGAPQQTLGAFGAGLCQAMPSLLPRPGQHPKGVGGRSAPKNNLEEGAARHWGAVRARAEQSWYR